MPSMMVTTAPLTLEIVMVLLLVIMGAYTPLVTEIVSFDTATSTALWIARNDVAQLVPAAVSLPLVLTYHVAACAEIAIKIAARVIDILMCVVI